MEKINSIIEKYITPKKIEHIKESSPYGSSMWFHMWSKAHIIYVKNEEVLFSTSWEFPSGSPMTEDIRARAKARGYIVLDCR